MRKAVIKLAKSVMSAFTVFRFNFRRENKLEKMASDALALEAAVPPVVLGF